MDTTASPSAKLVGFRSPKKFLSNLDASVAAKVVASAADIALIIENGVIKDIAVGTPDLTREGYESAWRGKNWVDTVSLDSRHKIEDLLNGAPQAGWRQVNHPSSGGADVPVRYTTVKTGPRDRIVAIGRDLRTISALQQRLVEAHQGLERDYAKLREAEARYRLLFRSVSEPVLIVDSLTLRVEESNPAADRHFDSDGVADTTLTDLFLSKSERAISNAAAEALSSGAAMSEPVTRRGGEDCRLAMSAFRLEDRPRLIVRVLGVAGAQHAEERDGNFARAFEALPDGLLVADTGLQILSANRAFAEMTGLSSSSAAVGRRVIEFLGRSNTDLNVLVANIKGHGLARNFSTILRDRFGAEELVEVSAVAAPAAKGDVYAFSIRNIARRLQMEPRFSERVPASAEQLANLVGKVPLKEIVRESTDLIEKLCIEAALEITDDNRASAAEMLGLSRQGLYSKLKRFGIAD